MVTETTSNQTEKPSDFELMLSPVFRMMANTFGLKTFKHGVVNYLQANKFSNARQDDLWEALTNVSHADGVLNEEQSVKEIMDTWTLQMGFPVVNVRRDYGQNDDCSFLVDQ